MIMFKVSGRLTAEKISRFTWGECGPCPFFACYILVFALNLREKHGKNLRVVEKIQEGTIACVDITTFRGSQKKLVTPVSLL